MKLAWALPWSLIACLVIAGCGASGDGTASRSDTDEDGTPAPTPRGQPAHLRVANLSNAPVTAKFGAYEIEDIPVGDLSTVRPVSPGKTVKVTVGDQEYEVKTEGGKFATVVVKGDSMTGFTSGKSLSIAGAMVDVVNLTNGPLTFKVGAKDVEVPTMSSETMEVPIGALDVSAASAKVQGNVDTSQILGVYAVTEGGKTVLKMVQLKGSGAPVSGGGPSSA